MTAKIKHYDRLTAHERVSALFAAAARADKGEIQTLVHSAPRVHYTVAEHAGLFNGILHAAQLYRLWQLETAARLLLIALYDWTPDSEQTAERAGLYWVHLFKTRAAAWREVCSDYNIAPDAFNALLPGNDILEMTARVAADIETAPGDFAEDVRDLNGADAQPVTLESELAAFRALIAVHTL